MECPGVPVQASPKVKKKSAQNRLFLASGVFESTLAQALLVHVPNLPLGGGREGVGSGAMMGLAPSCSVVGQLGLAGTGWLWI